MFEIRQSLLRRHIIKKLVLTWILYLLLFQALVNYAQDGSYSWHCRTFWWCCLFKITSWSDVPPVFGENMLRADVCNAVDEIGQLLDHTGPVAASELNAARIFNSDHSYFVTNGTSTSNKIIWHATVARGYCGR